jgi:hypothetical protein
MFGDVIRMKSQDVIGGGLSRGCSPEDCAFVAVQLRKEVMDLTSILLIGSDKKPLSVGIWRRVRPVWRVRSLGGEVGKPRKCRLRIRTLEVGLAKVIWADAGYIHRMGTSEANPGG